MIQEELLLRLENNPVKEYAWGRSDRDCFVGRLSKKQGLKNYAELWMGVHCHGESHVRSIRQKDAMKLSQFQMKNGLKSLEYLFKVLSIEKCLSIQVHPNKDQATVLNQNQPNIYSDGNDKPEMFYTLTVFQCFFGYIEQGQFDRIMSFDVFNKVFSNQRPKNPREAIIAILKLEQEKQGALLSELMKTIQEIHPFRYQGTKGKSKIWNILADFPNDIGIVVSFFLDYKILEPGVCFYIESNTPHAYISGECLEIMKNSDNVCRLGLTPKFKDLKVIQEVLGHNFNQIKPLQGKIELKQGYMSALYSQKGLNLLVISYSRSGISGKRQKYIVEPHSEDRIFLILQGQFQIKTSATKPEPYLEGTVLLLKGNSIYEIESTKDKGEVCLGWSTF